MRATFSPIENTHDISVTPENDERTNDKPRRDIQRRSQRVFDIQDAQTLKNELDQTFKNRISQLTIFDKRDEAAESIQLFARQLEPERPVTPIDDELSNETIPRDVEQLLKLVRRRLNIQRPPDEGTRLTPDDLAELATVVLTQMRGKWLDIEDMRVQHPLLSTKRNHELVRRLFVNIISICANIFEHTVEESEVLHDRYIFSHTANMTRLRTLLADRINTLINIHSLREHLASEMIEEERLKKGLIFEETTPRSPRRRLDKHAVLAQQRPDIRDLVERAGKSYRYSPSALKYDSKKIFHQMVTSFPDANRLRRPPVLLPPIPRQSDSTVSMKKISSHVKTTVTQKPAVKADPAVAEKEKEDLSRVLKRAHYGSLPNIHEKFLCEELDFNFALAKKVRHKTTDLIREEYFIDEEKQKREVESAKVVSNQMDLVRLTTRPASEEREKEDDIPPLIKVLTSSHDYKRRIEECKQTVVAIAKRRKNYLDELKENVRDEPLCPQPASIEKTFRNITFRISDIAMANFYFQSSFLLTSFSTIFNNYFGDIDDDTVAYLDRNLHIGQQIKEVYEQLLSTIDLKRSFQMDMDKYVIAAPDRLNLTNAQASSTLAKPIPDRVNNTSLARRTQPPWVQLDNDRERWIQTPDPRQIEQEAEAKKKRTNKARTKGLVAPTVSISLVPDPEVIAGYKPRDARQARDFQLWKDYWTNVHTENDYLKYLSTQSTDYLHHIFHLHDPLPEDTRLSEEDQALLDQRNRAVKEREEKIAQLKERKHRFEQGQWNTESVFLGGLGNDPMLNPEEDPLIKFQNDVESKKPKSKRIDLFDPLAEQKAISSKRLLMEIMSSVKQVDVQKRLEQIWKLLRLTDNERLHMAVKYSTIEYATKIESALAAWDAIASLIIRREKFIGDLENFERSASDPNRFFEPGPMGSSKMRMSECRRRTYLYNQLSILEKQITEQWHQIKKTYGDIVTYNGRNYLDKMQFDKLEMLHYLQEERRLNYLHSFTSMGQRSELNSTFNHVL